MKRLLLTFCLVTSVASIAAARSSANYSIIAESFDSGAVSISSANFTIKTPTVGGIAGTVSGSSPVVVNKSGYAGQIFDVIALSISATPATVNETATTQLNAAQVIEDTTTLSLSPSSISWSIVSGPIASISTSGLLTPNVVFQNTPATAAGSFQNTSAQVNITVVNSNNDNFGAYANDGIDDAWQVQFFGLPPNAQAGPNADPDGDGANNLAEFQAGTDPTFPNVRLLNIATRMRVLAGERVLIAGFIITGQQPKKVLVRGIGPSLTAFGIQNALANPTLELHASDGSLLTSNDDWRDAPNAAAIQATGIPPSNDFESAILQTLAPGAYTAILRGKDSGIGVGVVESYDLDQSVPTKLANISTRGFVDLNENVMIGGLIVNGTGTSSPTVVVRAIGPSLAAFGIAGALQDPTLELHDGNGAIIAQNDDWKTSQQAQIQASGLAPSDDRESAILKALAPGSYTAIVRGAGNTVGVGVVEAYNIAQ
jgi:hypothetical protein